MTIYHEALMKKKIPILGGNGFIGMHFTQQLSTEYYIKSPSRKELDLLDTKKQEDIFYEIEIIW